MAESSISLNANQAVTGMNTDLTIGQLPVGTMTYVLNGNISNFDGNEITIGNDQANIECIQFPENYKVIGVKNITQLNKVVYFLTNPITAFSQIGYTDNDSCIYNILLDDTFAGSDLLNFNISNPIHKIEVKTTNCSTQLYWTDKLNPRRFIDLNNLPWKEVLIAGVFTPIVGNINTNRMLVQPNFSVPKIEALKENIGGNLVEGTYQFAIQYSDVLGNGYTSFYSVSNPVRIFLEGKISSNFNEVTNQAISLLIDNLDTTGLYDYFNLAVVKTINAITNVELVGTFYIQRPQFEYTYTGSEASKANNNLTIEDIFEKVNYYDLAGTLTQTDNVLVWGDLIKEDDISYQKIANQINLLWGTYQIPDNTSVNYSNGVTCANLQGFMRDEVYPFEIDFFHRNGKASKRFHIPGRVANSFDLQIIPNSNPDVSSTSSSLCSGPTVSPYRWQVYNTGSILGTESTYNPLDNCNPQPYQYGLMGYHESTELYPNNSLIWGTLANTPIRHHRFPDSLITHIHDENPYPVGSDQYNNYQHNIYPIGIKIDIEQIKQLIQSSTDLTQQQKDDIVGFRIMRGDRVNNKAVIAKGYLYNCGKYTKETSTYYYPNYPFNDVNPDSFISSAIVNDKSGSNTNTRLNDFQRGRFTFHSPDTSFYHPSGIDGSFLKLETAQYGQCKSHFVPVKDNAREKLRTIKDLEIALAGGVASIVGLEGSYSFTTGSLATSTVGIAPSFHSENFFPTFNNVLEIIDKLIPYTNYGWQYNGVGFYGNYNPIANNGSKIRSIENGGYITTGLQGTFGDDHAINNSYRESSVYLNTGDKNLLYAFENGSTPDDNSRVTAGELGFCNSSNNFYRDISSYYASIKRYLPAQWGQIFSYEPIDTGKYYTFNDNKGFPITKIDTIFGGDIFINRFALKRKHSFFLKSTVNKPDGYDIDYDQQGNVGYPIWYYSTSNNVLNINNTAINNATTNFINTLDNWLLNILLGGIPILVTGVVLLVALLRNGLLTSLGIKITNLECYNGDGLYETGQAYLYAYGIPYFYVESEVNVNMRQAINIKEGDFYPQVSTDIPDDWLQETNVPIIYDNSYVYNKTYSKQNKENIYGTLRPDWNPDEPCFTYFPNSAIWSDKSSLEETKNNWLVYRPANEYSFPKAYGKLTALDTLDNNQVLARFENKSQIYNAFTTVQVSQGPDAYLSNTKMFSNIPLDLSNTDTGSYGSQHKFILRTENGTISVDAKRGQVYLLQNTSIVDIADKGMDKWFSENLPFKILNYFPNINIDNSFNQIGLNGVYDNFYKRLILTKLDYEPLSEAIKYDGTNFYIDSIEIPESQTTIPSSTYQCCPDSYEIRPSDAPPYVVCFNPQNEEKLPIGTCISPEVINAKPGYRGKTIISVNDPNYFCNKSWSISFSFKTNSWISFHSFTPNYYIAHENYFQSGVNTLESLWDHNIDYTNFSSYYGTIYPYILEYPFHYKINDEILQNIKDYTTVIKYQDQDNWTELDETIYFNKAIIYNGQQCTGLLNLIPKSNISLRDYNRYPINNLDSKDILVTKSDSFYQYNQFYNILKNPVNNIWLNTCEFTETNKELNIDNLDYGLRSFKKDQIRGKYCIIRHIKDDDNTFKLISKFILSPTIPSYK